MYKTLPKLWTFTTNEDDRKFLSLRQQIEVERPDGLRVRVEKPNRQ